VVPAVKRACTVVGTVHAVALFVLFVLVVGTGTREQEARVFVVHIARLMASV